MKKNLSFYSYWMVVVLLLTSAFVNDVWRSKNTIHAFTFDSMGYYLYLPALFIYNDIEHFEFLEELLPKYNINDNAYRPETLPSGKKLDKYAVGQALFQAPGFFLAHILAKPLGYPADGYSLPYHAIISLVNILIGLLALWYLRRILLSYFPDAAVACSLLLLLIATNYWCYIGFDSHMTHASLFALYVFLLWHTIKWHHHPNWTSSIAIGGVVGFAVLMRPTEIVSVVLPLLWSNLPNSNNGNSLSNNVHQNYFGNIYQQLKIRVIFLVLNYPKLLVAVMVGAAFISLQLAYWKIATGQWIYYSYGDQKLNFFKAHIAQVLYSYKKGWLTYTPIMILALLGFVPLFRTHKNLFWPVLVFFIINFYLVSCWSVWWYGGSYGQRALVQSYAILMLPFTAFFAWAIKVNKIIWALLFPMIALCVWLNITQTFCGILDSEGNTRAYFWHVFGKYKVSLDDRKYLQVNEKFTKTHYKTETLYTNVFIADKDTTHWQNEMLLENPINTNNVNCDTEPNIQLCSPVLCLDTLHRKSATIDIPLRQEQQKGWLRIAFNALCIQKEWNYWKQHYFILIFMEGDKEVKTIQMRPVLIMDCGNWTPITFDSEIPKQKNISHLRIYMGDGSTSHTLYLDDLRIERLY